MSLGKVSLKGLIHEDSQYAFNGASGLVEADEGKVVTLDTTAANTVKLAGDGDIILGTIQRVEVRTQEGGIIVVTVNLAGGVSFKRNTDASVSPDQIPAIGDYIVGGTLNSGAKGYVNKSATPTKFQVVELASATELIAISV